MSRKVKAAAIQMRCSNNVGDNIKKADEMTREAVKKGANIILLPELFERQYFCQERRYEYYAYAKSVQENDAVQHFTQTAKELGVVIIVSFYEKNINVLYNTVTVIDADGSNLGICWDQWFPETARALAVNGAEILFYPTAIGSEPILECDSMPHWRRCMQGHAGCNLVPVVAANRIGIETVDPCEANGGQKSSLKFYGSSFITDNTGEVICEAGRDTEEVLVAQFDLDEYMTDRLSWGLFRDRRPEIYN